jgi:mono/diheme cytochrome c family protein
MVRQLMVAAVALALTASGGLAQTKTGKKSIERTKIDGKVMFENYCAVCHGLTGKGDGPAASELKTSPTDLTMLSSNNNGVFPEVRVRRYIEGADEVAAHGTRDMPMWGDLFKSLGRDMAPIRISQLVTHVNALQKK